MDCNIGLSGVFIRPERSAFKAPFHTIPPPTFPITFPHSSSTFSPTFPAFPHISTHFTISSVFLISPKICELPPKFPEILRVTPGISPKFCELPPGFPRNSASYPRDSCELPPGFLRVTPGIPANYPRDSANYPRDLLCRTITLSIRAPFLKPVLHVKY